METIQEPIQQPQPSFCCEIVFLLIRPYWDPLLFCCAAWCRRKAREQHTRTEQPVPRKTQRTETTPQSKSHLVSTKSQVLLGPLSSWSSHKHHMCLKTGPTEFAPSFQSIPTQWAVLDKSTQYTLLLQWSYKSVSSSQTRRSSLPPEHCCIVWSDGKSCPVQAWTESQSSRVIRGQKRRPKIAYQTPTKAPTTHLFTYRVYKKAKSQSCQRWKCRTCCDSRLWLPLLSLWSVVRNFRRLCSFEHGMLGYTRILKLTLSWGLRRMWKLNQATSHMSRTSDPLTLIGSWPHRSR